MCCTWPYAIEFYILRTSEHGGQLALQGPVITHPLPLITDAVAPLASNMDDEEHITSSDGLLDLTVLPSNLVKVELPGSDVPRMTLALLQVVAFARSHTKRFTHVLRSHDSQNLHLILDVGSFEECIAPHLPVRSLPVHWRALRLCLGGSAGGTIALAGECGIAASVTKPLAAAGVSIDYISLYDSDLLLVLEDELSHVKQVLSEAFDPDGQQQTGTKFGISGVGSGISAALSLCAGEGKGEGKGEGEDEGSDAGMHAYLHEITSGLVETQDLDAQAGMVTVVAATDVTDGIEVPACEQPQLSPASEFSETRLTSVWSRPVARNRRPRSETCEKLESDGAAVLAPAVMDVTAAEPLRLVQVEGAFVVLTFDLPGLNLCCAPLMAELLRAPLAAVRAQAKRRSASEDRLSNVYLCTAAQSENVSHAQDKGSSLGCPFFALFADEEEASLIVHELAADTFPAADIGGAGGASSMHERWGLLQLPLRQGQMQSGILARLTGPLAADDISVFVVTSPDVLTVMVEKEYCERAASILEAQGFVIV